MLWQSCRPGGVCFLVILVYSNPVWKPVEKPKGPRLRFRPQYRRRCCLSRGNGEGFANHGFWYWGRGKSMSENGRFLYTKCIFPAFNWFKQFGDCSGRAFERNPLQKCKLNGFVSIFDASHSIGTILHMQSAHIHAKKGGNISEKVDFKWL